MARQKVDTPRTGRAWCDVVNKEAPPPAVWHKMTLEDQVKALKGEIPLVRSRIQDIIDIIG